MIVIFGSSGALGKGILDKLIQKNKNLLLTANNGFEKLKLDFIEAPNIEVMQCNVLETENILGVFKHLRNNQIKIEGLINNFAFTYDDNIEKMDPDSDEVKKVFEVNYNGTAIIFEELVKYLQDINHHSVRVVNVLSNSIKTLNASNNHYIASKAATETLSKFYAKNFSKLISINNVAPGLMKSEITKHRFDNISEKIIDLTPLGRLSTIEEASRLICFLATESPLSICGQTIYIDGGRTL